MFELIVIDDEINIREGIKNFISQNHSDISVVGCFEDGCDGIEFLKNHKVDIIITDIKMLITSGIEVAKYVHENTPQTKVIILSGYREFEYARTAMTYNVKHYLIKPTDLKELSEVLYQTVRELSKEVEEREHLIYYEKYAPMLKNELLSDILMGAIKERDVFDERFELLETGMKPDDCGFCVVDLVIDDYSGYLSQNWAYGKDQFNIATKNFLEAQNTESFFVFHVLNEKDFMKLFCVLNKDSEENMQKMVNEHLNNVKKWADENLKIRLEFKIENLYSSAESMLSSYDRRPDSVYSGEQLRLLMSHINLKNYREIDNIIDAYIKSFDKTSFEEAKQHCLLMLKTIAENLEKNSFYEENSAELTKVKEIDMLASCMQGILSKLAHEIKESETTVIKRAKEFIDTNFSKDISLEDVAEHVFLNPAYFSRYFKQYAGENFTAYLFKRRIEHAKILLGQRLTVEKIAKECGYSSTRYFVQSFKKHTGMTPKEYRIKS